EHFFAGGTQELRALLDSSSRERPLRMLQALPDALQEGSGGRAIDRPVIEGQAQGHCVPPFGSPWDANQLLSDAPNAENGDLRRVDDGRERVDPVHAQIGHTKSAAHQFIAFERALATPGGKPLYLLGDLPQWLAV